MRKEELPKLAKWIREARGSMRQEEFGNHICHYEIKYEKSDETKKDGKKVCSTYHRNQVSNWERGKSRNISIEGFLSIALFVYDRQAEEDYNTCENRNKRLAYAREELKNVLGEELYARNLHAALLIQVCRNILSFEKLLEKETEYEEKLSHVQLVSEKKRELSLEYATENILTGLNQIENIEELDRLFEKNKSFFYTANRTLGERLLKLYEEKDRYQEKIDFKSAVRLYAPNYKDTYFRIFSSSKITKGWLMDLCTHLRFEEEERENILKLAHMQFLMDEEEPESTVQDEDAKGVLKEKFGIALLLAIYVKDEMPESLPPVEYLIESFSYYTQGKGVLKNLQDIVRETNWQNVEEYGETGEELLKTWNCKSQNQAETRNCEHSSQIETWKSYINEFYCETAGKTNQKLWKLYQLYKAEHKEYYCMGDRKLENITDKTDREEAIKLHYLTALFYTVFTGKYYSGEVTAEDNRIIRRQFENVENNQMTGKNHENQNDLMKNAYYFLSEVIGIFLSQDPLMECKTEVSVGAAGKKNSVKYCVYDEKREKTSKKIDMDEICEDLWSILIDA